jgi:dihydrofolate reductase
MGKVIVSEFVTLDGVIEAPGGEDSLGERSGWTRPFWDEEAATLKYAELLACDALLMGRRTYQGHAAIFPSLTDEQGIADRMNNLPKYVVSTTLENVEWNNSRLIKGNVKEAVNRLKHEIERDISIGGSGELVHALMQQDLIDEYRLMVFPVVVGSGKRFWRTGSELKRLRLVESRSLRSDIVVLSYQPAEPFPLQSTGA